MAHAQGGNVCKCSDTPPPPSWLWLLLSSSDNLWPAAWKNTDKPNGVYFQSRRRQDTERQDGCVNGSGCSEVGFVARETALFIRGKRAEKFPVGFCEPQLSSLVCVVWSLVLESVFRSGCFHPRSPAHPPATHPTTLVAHKLHFYDRGLLLGTAWHALSATCRKASSQSQIDWIITMRCLATKTVKLCVIGP